MRSGGSDHDTCDYCTQLAPPPTGSELQDIPVDRCRSAGLLRLLASFYGDAIRYPYLRHLPFHLLSSGKMYWKCRDSLHTPPDEIMCKKLMSLGEALVVVGIMIVALLIVPILGGLCCYGMYGWAKFFKRRREKHDQVRDCAVEGGKFAAVPAGEGDGDHWIELQSQDP